MINLSISENSVTKSDLIYFKGTKGDCHNGCCFFRPPSKNIPAPPPSPSWFESNNGSCDDTSLAVNKPIIMNGKVINKDIYIYIGVEMNLKTSSDLEAISCILWPCCFCKMTLIILTHLSSCFVFGNKYH